MDDKVFENVEESIMVGGAIKVSPILKKMDSNTY